MLIQTREEFNAALTALIETKLLAVDTETVKTDIWDQRLLIGIGTYCELASHPGKFVAFYFPFRHEIRNTLLDQNQVNLPLAWLRELSSALSRTDVVQIYHNAKFDITVLERDGISINAKFWDTMIMSHMIDENSRHSLEALAHIHLGINSANEKKQIKDIEKGVGRWEAIPPVIMGRYCEKDAELTYRLFWKLKRLLDEQELTPLWKDEYEFCKVLMAIEWRGIGLDLDRAKSLAEQTKARLGEILDELGFDPAKKNTLAQRLFGTPPEGLGLVPGSLSGSRTRLFPRGIPIMDKAALSSFTHPCIDLILEYRSHSKAFSTWYQGFLDKVCEDGRLHTEYRQHGTKTTRLSCANPNMQQIPRRKEEEEEQAITKDQVKSLLCTKREDYELWEFDYSQVEFRLAAVYAKEKVVLEGYKKGVDFHSTTAKLLEVDRYTAKTINFAILYGAGSRKLAEELRCSEKRARQVLKDYREMYPGFAKAAQKAEAAAVANGYIKLWTNRRRHFEYPSEYHKAFNSAIQGGAAEIMKKTMIQMHKAGFFVVAQVHDSLWIELPKDNLEVQIKEVKRIMEWPSTIFVLEFPVEYNRIS